MKLMSEIFKWLAILMVWVGVVTLFLWIFNVTIWDWQSSFGYIGFYPRLFFLEILYFVIFTVCAVTFGEDDILNL